MAPTAESRYTKFGWHGIEIAVPAAWELAAYHGTRKAGYACLDDGRDMRLQVRWSGSNRGEADLDGVLRRYQRSLTKVSKGNLEFDREGSGLRRNTGDATIRFRWRSDREALGLARHCRACGRVVIMEVLFPVGESDKVLAGRIMDSITDHRDDGCTLWSVYGFAFCIPSTYDLDQADFVPGRLRFLLRSSRAAWLRVERWALASQWLDKAPLEVWPEELLKLMRVSLRGTFDKSETRVQGHSALRFSGAVAGRGFLRKERVAGLVWHSPEQDKAFAVMAAGGTDGLIEEVANTVRTS